MRLVKNAATEAAPEHLDEVLDLALSPRCLVPNPNRRRKTARRGRARCRNLGDQADGRTFTAVQRLRQDATVILYKYVPPERIDILHSGRIAFSDPKMFNDPFEVSPVLAADDPDAILLHRIRTLLRTEPTFRDRLKTLERRHPGLTKGGEFVISERTEEEIQARIDKLQDEHGMKRLVYENATNIIGVLSLSAVPDSILMWAHYTAQHKGFVIGFDTAHPSWLKMQEGTDVGRPVKVTYAKRRPAPQSMDDVRPDHIWYTKSDVWSYEEEWRVTRFIGLPQRRADLRVAVPLYPFPKEAVVKVILGCRSSAQLAFDLNQLQAEVPELRNYEVLRAELDERRFRLNIVRA